MKQQIHPNFHEDVLVTCSCGSTFKTGSTRKTIGVEVCSKCHPFYTGEQKFLDAKGTVDKFLKREKDAKAFKLQNASKKNGSANKSERSGKSLRELLGEI